MDPNIVPQDQPAAQPGGQINEQVIQPTVSPEPQAVAPAASPPAAPAATPVESVSAATPQTSDVRPQVFNPGINPVNSSASQTVVGSTFEQPATVIGGDVSGGSFKAPGNKKKLLLIGLPVVLVLLAVGYVFGIFIPNKPNNVYNTGLDRSGKALTKLLANVDKEQSIKELKKSEISSTITAKMDNKTYSGTFNSKMDPDKADGKLELKTSDNKESFTVQYKSELIKGEKLPNIYFQVTGLSTFGLDAFIPKDKVENRWFVLDKTFWDQMGTSAESLNLSGQDQLTSDDYAGVIKAIAQITEDRIFTSDQTKSMLKMKSFVGKDKKENAYQYKMSLNKANADGFCDEFTSKISETSAYKKLIKSKEDQDNTKKEFLKSCQEAGKNIQEDETFYMWVDAKYKLIKKIRFTDKGNADSYSEIGQNYKGDDELTMFVNFHDKTGDFNGTINTNVKTNLTKGTLKYKSEGGAVEVDANLEAKPFTGDINSTKPANTVPIQQLLEELGAGDLNAKPSVPIGIDG